MSKLTSLTLFESLASITDPHLERTKEHKLVDILVIAVCATICGAESWEEIAEFGRAKQEWFAGLLELPNGIASHDTFRRVFLLLKPSALQVAFLDWVQGAVRLTGGALVSIDGKHLRGSKKSARRQRWLTDGECVGHSRSVWCWGRSRRRSSPMRSRRSLNC